MELKALNEDFDICGSTSLTCFDIMWHRKYYENGMFSVQIRAEDYDPEMKYIYTNERPELGDIEQIKYTQDDSMVVLSGFFYERRLNDKIVYPMFKERATRSKFIADAVDTYKDDLPIVVDGNYPSGGSAATRQDTGSNLDELAHKTLQAEERAYRCVYDYENNRMTFEIYQGKDRTQSQNANNFVVFSKGFRNIRKASVTEDSSNFKNYFVCGGQGEGSARIYATLDLSGGGYKRMQFLDMRDVEYNSSKMTLAEYGEALQERAKEKAAEYVDIHNVEFDADATTSFVYLRDYDLGDKCDIIIDPIMRSYEARIIEVIESWSKGVHQVTLTFGDKIPTQYEKARIR